MFIVNEVKQILAAISDEGDFVCRTTTQKALEHQLVQNIERAGSMVTEHDKEVTRDVLRTINIFLEDVWSEVDVKHIRLASDKNLLYDLFNNIDGLLANDDEYEVLLNASDRPHAYGLLTNLVFKLRELTAHLQSRNISTTKVD